MEFADISGKLFNKLGKEGVLLTAGVDKSNTMTVNWATIGYMWGKPVLVVPVRKIRYTYSFIEKTGAFTVSICEKNKKKMLSIFGDKSGREVDKYSLANISTIPAKAVNGRVIDQPGYHIECKVLYMDNIDKAHMDPEIVKKYYGSDEGHTLIFGEIVSAYKK